MKLMKNDENEAAYQMLRKTVGGQGHRGKKSTPTKAVTLILGLHSRDFW